MKVVTLFGGSSETPDRAYADAAFEFGRLVAEKGWILRTGAGSGENVMGRAADGALSADGRVEGVILKMFWQVRHRRLHQLTQHATFPRRKAGLLRGTSAIAVFPGGFGTLDELSEVLTLKQNGFLDLPIVLVSIRKYYDPLVGWFREGVRHGFLHRRDLGLFRVARSSAAAVGILASAL